MEIGCENRNGVAALALSDRSSGFITIDLVSHNLCLIDMAMV